MTLEKLISEFEAKSLEEELSSKEFQAYKDNLKYDWEPAAFKNRITEEDIKEYLW